MSDETPAVYSAVTAIDPLSVRLCAALHALPAARLLTCCQRGTVSFESECTRTLSASVAAGAIELKPSQVAQCEQAMQERLRGCDWVGRHGIPLPSACIGIIQGKLNRASRCRSSLECAEGLFCHAAGPTDWGTCQPPAADGAACALSVDSLAAYSRDRLEGRHDECEGTCERHRCSAAHSSCVSSVQCAGGQHCNAEGQCVLGSFAQAQQSCSPGSCVDDLRCLRGRCVVPGAVGATCLSDDECHGSCDKVTGLCAAHCL